MSTSVRVEERVSMLSRMGSITPEALARAREEGLQHASTHAARTAGGLVHHHREGRPC